MAEFIDTERLIEQKQKYETLIASAHTDIDSSYCELKSAFERAYPTYSKFDLYDITDIGFWFGDVACDYNGENFELSQMMFSLTDQLEDVKVFDLNLKQTIQIYNAISTLSNEVYNSSFATIKKANLSISNVINKLKMVTDHVVKMCYQEQYDVNAKLGQSIQKLYVLLDFALCDDDEDNHYDLRSLHSETLATQSTLYDRISAYQERIIAIEELLESSSKNQAKKTTPVDTEKEQHTIQQHELSQEKKAPKRKSSVKERLVNTFGTFGGILYFVIRIIIFVLPFVMIGGGFLLSFVLISINAVVPFASIVFWIWGLVCAIKGVQDVLAIIYYVAFAIIWLPFYISLLLDLKNK